MSNSFLSPKCLAEFLHEGKDFQTHTLIRRNDLGQFCPCSALQLDSNGPYAFPRTWQKIVTMLPRRPYPTVNHVHVPVIARMESGSGTGYAAVIFSHAALR